MSSSAPLVVAFGHKAKNGKGEACATIVERFQDQFTFQRVSFADPLRAEVEAAAREAFMTLHMGRPFDPAEAMAILCKRAGVPFDPNASVEPNYPYGKQRKLYQWWGTEFRRAQDPNYWVKKAHETIAASPAQFVLIDDLRFLNEAYFIEDELHGVTVKINRVGFDNGCSDHPSEHELDDFPFAHVIDALEGDLEGLHTAVAELFEQIVGVRTPDPDIFDDLVPENPDNPSASYTIAEAELDIALNAAVRGENG